MLKKIMLYLMLLVTGYKCLALAILCATDIERLPAAVCISTGLVVLLGVVLGARHYLKASPTRELAFYYGVSAASVIFNLVAMRLFSRVEVTVLDLLVIGTVMDLLVDLALVVMASREHRYVCIRMKTDA